MLSLIALLISINMLAQDWTQVGQDIDGDINSIYSGCAVSMPNAVTIAVGDKNYTSGSGFTGMVRVYTFDGSNWNQKGIGLTSDSSANQFGGALSMPDPNTIAIGSVFAGGNGHESGQVKVFVWSGTTWIQKGNDINGEAVNDHSGHSVCMPDENTIAIGAVLNDGNGLSSGHIRIYHWVGNAWVLKGTDIDGKLAGDGFGQSVSMPDENTVAIGGNGNAGNVQIYIWNGNTWIQKGSDLGSGWGHSVSMADENTVAIGSPDYSGLANLAGRTRIYKWNNTTWVQKGADINGEALGDFSGTSVSMPDINTVAIGANQNDGNGSSSGHVRIYIWRGSNWVKKGMDLDGEWALDESGSSVSMPDPFTVGIGAPENSELSYLRGHVRVYSRCIVDTRVSTLGSTIQATAVSAGYQWLDCNNGYVAINGQTSQTYSPVVNGFYAVEVNQNGCVDTSYCVNIDYVGVCVYTFKDKLQIFPNPTAGSFNIEFGRLQNEINIKVRNKFGQQVANWSYNSVNNVNCVLEGTSGLYYLELTNDKRERRVLVLSKD